MKNMEVWHTLAAAQPWYQDGGETGHVIVVTGLMIALIVWVWR